MFFLGLDLAWSPRNRSGVALLQGGAEGAEVLDVRLLGGDAEILDYVQAHVQQEAAVIAIDAPLRVQNQRGCRTAEKALNRVFRTYQAMTHPANRQLLEYGGVVRGEVLVQGLAEMGFALMSTLNQKPGERQIVEVFPHAAMVAIFGLDQILRYKAKPKRSRLERLQEWQRYQNLLRSLSNHDPWLRGQEKILDQEVNLLRGQNLKNYEDQVDALMCGYIALFGFRWGKLRCQSFGCDAEGAIFTPVPKAD
jgi:predicted RNase H-like nuclease